MAITRRQFVTRLGTLAAAMGVSQVDLSKVVEAFAHGSAWAGAWTSKPKVVWVHGAECTGCSTSLLSLFEDVRGKAIEAGTTTTLQALNLAVGGTATTDKVIAASDQHPFGHRTLYNTRAAAGCDFDGVKNATPYVANIADVLIDFIDLQYHETVMSMGGDLAYKWLEDQVTNGSTAPYVLVVEGAIQPSAGGGMWEKTGAAPWCSIGMNGSAGGVGELAFDEVVSGLAADPNCAAVIPIGQCACFGGYPACVSPVLGGSQTGALGTYDFLKNHASGAENKVIAVPGCPTNPWWFVLTVVAWLVDATAILGGGSSVLNILGPGLSINTSAVDSQRRLRAVYGQLLHGPTCSRYQDNLNGVYASKPGDHGCLKYIGCKGLQTKTLCGAHGWNAQQPRNYENNAALEYGVGSINGNKGGNCVAGGHPCMGCTEKGYPDAFLPFLVRS